MSPAVAFSRRWGAQLPGDFLGLMLQTETSCCLPPHLQKHVPYCDQIVTMMPCMTLEAPSLVASWAHTQWVVNVAVDCKAHILSLGNASTVLQKHSPEQHEMAGTNHAP